MHSYKLVALRRLHENPQNWSFIVQIRTSLPSGSEIALRKAADITFISMIARTLLQFLPA